MIERRRRVGRHVRCTTGEVRCTDLYEVAFESVSDLLADADLGWLLRLHAHGGLDWSGTRSVTELSDKLERGWPELEERMLRMVDEVRLPDSLTKPEIVRKRKRRRADFGNEVDIHAVRQGRCDTAWTRTVHEPKESVSNRLVHVDVCVGAAAYVPHDAGLWRGAVVLRIYEALLRMRKSVAVSGYYVGHAPFWGSELRNAAGMCSVRMKDYAEPLSASKLALLTSLGFGRCYLMSAGMRRHSDKEVSPGVGRPIDDYDLPCCAAEEDRERGAQIVHVGQCFSREQAEEVLAKFADQMATGAEQRGLTADQLMLRA